VQREIFTSDDLWHLGSVCPCSGNLRPVNIAHWEPLISQASMRCEDCGLFWKVKIELEPLPVIVPPAVIV
jgi:hypothetical protein